MSSVDRCPSCGSDTLTPSGTEQAVEKDRALLCATELKRLKRALFAQREAMLEANKALFKAHTSPGAIDRLVHDFEKLEQLLDKIDKMIPPEKD
jgi:hypothetical protein